MVEDKKFILITGKLGAINSEIAFREEVFKLGGEELSETDKIEIRSKVESMDWKDGSYIIDETGIHYER
jgi:hypothetical protein